MLKKWQFLYMDWETWPSLYTIENTSPVLALPIFSAPFVLESDASGTCIVAVMLQEGKSIAYFSVALFPRNSALSKYEKEALEILEALKKGCHYFLGKKLIIKIDYQYLKFITN